MNHQPIRVGEQLIAKWPFVEVIITVKFHSEVPIAGSCDLTIESIVAEVPGLGRQEFTRNNIKPEIDQEWCVETLPGQPMVTLRRP